MQRHGNDRHEELVESLARYQIEIGQLPGLHLPGATDTLVRQMIASLRRIEYIRLLGGRNHDERKRNPNDPSFDPLAGAVIYRNEGNYDEAVWLTFLATQFGKHKFDGWKLCANVYGSFGLGPIWTSAEYRARPDDFAAMLRGNSASLADAQVAGRYSNHRQYVSRKPDSLIQTFSEAAAWLFGYGTFIDRVRVVQQVRGREPTDVFDDLYHSMKMVHSYGRLGAFDLLTMLGKLNLAPIYPGSTYLVGATGPLRGARLLFLGSTDHPATGRALQARFDQLDEYIMIGKQPLEDSICNWQKSPRRFIPFRG